ncbi:MAG: hypothetical protein U9N49_00470 [Campylobacterota bacterium]|nr:hypothetical protein [Campylobacterota bacterium]
MKFILTFLILITVSFANTCQILYYTPKQKTQNYKSLKVLFDNYLKPYGSFEFQPFSDKKTFEEFVKNNNCLFMLSGYHFKEIAKTHNLRPILVEQSRNTVSETNVLIAKGYGRVKGIVTSAFSTKYTNKLVKKSAGTRLEVLKVPKEIDALMALGYGMSQVAAVSRESFEHLKKVNPSLTKDMRIVSESLPIYRMIVAAKSSHPIDSHKIQLFKRMHKDRNGRKALRLLGIDKIVKLNQNQLTQLGAR